MKHDPLKEYCKHKTKTYFKMMDMLEEKYSFTREQSAKLVNEIANEEVKGWFYNK